MAKKGGSNHQKRMAAKGTVVNRKAHIWLSKPVPGPHKASKAVSLIVLLRDLIKVGETKKEIKKILNSRDILVDGRIITEEHFPIGLMDIISIPRIKKHYRVLVDTHGRLTPNEITEEQAKFKVCRVEDKKTGKNGKISVILHDGRNLNYDKKCGVGDSVKLALDKKEISKEFKLQEGAKCLIIDGKHVGELAVLTELIPGTATRNAEAKLKKDNGQIITVKKYLFPVGDVV